jgi:hypothetical protein
VSFGRRGRPGLLRTVARTSVIAGTATATANAVDRRASARAGQQAADQAPAPPASPAPAGVGANLVDQLTELARLRHGGLLTEAEFDTAKSRLLTS